MIASAASQKRRPVALRVLVDSSLAPSGATIVVDSPASDPDSDSVHHLLSAEALFLPLPMPADKPRARALGLRISVADNRPAAAVLESPSSSPSTILSADTFPSPSPSSAELAPAAPTPAASRRNRKGLSLSVHPQPSSGSLRSLASSSASTTHSRPPPSSLPASPASTHAAAPSIPLIAPVPHPPRRASVTSLPPSRVVHRAVEDAAPGTPYADGPVEILPGIWLGTEENARDWDALKDRGIGYVLNVAKEVLPPFFPSATQPVIFGIPMHLPADEPSGQPELCYLHLPWSHGQSDLVQLGFPAAMDFVDRAREAGSGVLIHCQCGVSRSATLVIAIVMRAARLPNAGADMKDVRDGGMHAAYAFTKQRSRWISPNMSLIYQLLEYERHLSPPARAPSECSVRSEEEEWTRRRRAMEEAEEAEERERADIDIARGIEDAEAKELDQRMVERFEVVRRKSSATSFASSASLSMVAHQPPPSAAPWKKGFGGAALTLPPPLPTSSVAIAGLPLGLGRVGRTRAGSVESNYTGRSMLSEESVPEEDEDGECAGESEHSSALAAPPPAHSSSSSSSSRAVDEDVVSALQTFTMPSLSRGNSDLAPPPSAAPTRTAFAFPSFPLPSASSSSSTLDHNQYSSHYAHTQGPPSLTSASSASSSPLMHTSQLPPTLPLPLPLPASVQSQTTQGQTQLSMPPLGRRRILSRSSTLETVPCSPPAAPSPAEPSRGNASASGSGSRSGSGRSVSMGPYAHTSASTSTLTSTNGMTPEVLLGVTRKAALPIGVGMGQARSRPLPLHLPSRGPRTDIQLSQSGGSPPTLSAAGGAIKPRSLSLSASPPSRSRSPPLSGRGSTPPRPSSLAQQVLISAAGSVQMQRERENALKQGQNQSEAQRPQHRRRVSNTLIIFPPSPTRSSARRHARSNSNASGISGMDVGEGGVEEDLSTAKPENPNPGKPPNSGMMSSWSWGRKSSIAASAGGLMNASSNMGMNPPPTPSTLTLTTTMLGMSTSPPTPTPTIANFRKMISGMGGLGAGAGAGRFGKSRTVSWSAAPTTPTVACSRVDARGWIGDSVGSVGSVGMRR